MISTKSRKMGRREESDSAKLRRARRRVAELKGFYAHLIVFLVVNTVIVVVKLIGTAHYGETFMGPFWHFSTYGIWLFWGIGLAFHAAKVFGLVPFLGRDWEERQIQKYMDQDKKDVEKYK